jgi:hypothetical protein
VEDALTNQLLEVPFCFPATAGQSAFVLGLGGGCNPVVPPAWLANAFVFEPLPAEAT